MSPDCKNDSCLWGDAGYILLMQLQGKAVSWRNCGGARTSITSQMIHITTIMAEVGAAVAES